VDRTECELPETTSPFPEIAKILATYERIAVVGCSPKAVRDSHKVARYLMENGYEVIPVNPGQKQILGRTCYKSLKEIPDRVEVVDIFLNPKRVPAVVEEAIEIGAKVVWMQFGIVDNASAQKAREHGIQVVMDHCMAEDHRKISSQK
jgi:predicted CoA-binding protein